MSNNIKINIEVEDNQLDETIEKVIQLRSLLEEVASLIESLKN